MPGRGPLRQSQVIAPFGPGAIHTDRFGVSLICCGLDHWFSKIENETDCDEFKIIDEWRINRSLGVDHLRKPPDYRNTIPGIDVPNIGMTIPFLRFPTWHYCSNCGHMKKTSLTYQGLKDKNICPVCYTEKSFKIPLVQVRFAVVCDHGHIHDFPWNEWAHQDFSPDCGEDSLRLVEYGGGTLDSIEVICTKCKKRKRLGGITSGELKIKGEPFQCNGRRLWLHDNEGIGCGRPVRGVLRNSSNIYFSQIFSSIFLPKIDKKTDVEIEEITRILEKPGISDLIDVLISMDTPIETILEKIKGQYGKYFQEYNERQVLSALQAYLNTEKEPQDCEASSGDSYDRESFRREEYRILAEEWDIPYLNSEKVDLEKYSDAVSLIFSKIMLIKKVRETRVFTGFTRLDPPEDQNFFELRRSLWLNDPEPSNSWLPASIVNGEGLFLEFNRTTLVQWLEGPEKETIGNRISNLRRNYENASRERGGFGLFNELHPVFILIHTVSHLLMNQLTFECGYSSASLRERLYFSTDESSPMAALLIYTAAGDSEGTMGGLVRMGKPGLFEPMLKDAVRKSQWCSADPVCMELGDMGGQGPYSCNLAACHNCALVPETSCEEFNRFLDRGLVTGTVENRALGFLNVIFDQV
ncbi:DUF1998 domain-containing protein [Desulfobacula phenolica]|uniref:MrfA-like Zn-binding domain-containing protein n=1 Tax=Desulfobacula phenolica TaxID=90732 RepID=A0A1H2J2F4_9BACT|nr:DUF1998 domain-containing protein [Desulfobacula phenolica]SDU50346.1 protein of unknown function [Desulfobacula phenolica]